MTKADLVALVSAQTGTDKVKVKIIIDSLTKNIRESLKNNNNVYLRGFGSFLVVKKAEKNARDIRKNKSVVIPAHCAPKFKPVRAFMDEVKENVPV